jgi:hypothetical protein
MGTEVAIPVFCPLTLLGILALLYVMYRSRRAEVTDSSILGLGRFRLASGYLGLLLAIALCSLLDTIALSSAKVREGEVTQAYADGAFFSWFLNLYFLAVPFLVVTVTMFGLPGFAVLRRVRLASVLGAVLIGLMFLAVLAVCFRSFPGWSDAVWATTVPVGFGFGAGLPLLRSQALPANLRWSGP